MSTPAHGVARLEAVKTAALAQKALEERERVAELAGLQMQEPSSDASPPPVGESDSSPRASK